MPTIIVHYYCPLLLSTIIVFQSARHSSQRNRKTFFRSIPSLRINNSFINFKVEIFINFSQYFVDNKNKQKTIE